MTASDSHGRLCLPHGAERMPLPASTMLPVLCMHCACAVPAGGGGVPEAAVCSAAQLCGQGQLRHQAVVVAESRRVLGSCGSLIYALPVVLTDKL